MQVAQKPMEVSTDVPNSARFRLPSVMTFFNRRWWWITLLMVAGFAVLVRLGFWQLDRLGQRRAYNAAVLDQLAQPPVSLNARPLPAEPADLENRQAVAQGKYDLSRQLALTHQNWLDSPGFHLIAPLVLDQGQQSEDGRPTAVLVDRGWLPAAQLQQENWSQYDVTEPVAVTGYIQLSQTVPNAEVLGESTGALQSEWYRVDVAAIEAQLPYRLLPVYLQEAPSLEGNIKLPFQSELDADLSEGNHFSYAIQWFIFATILAVGYVYLVGKKAGERAGGRG